MEPDYAVAPGETLQETLQALGMTQSELARCIGHSEEAIDAIMQGNAAITVDIVLQLERVLGVPASFWLNLEQNYRFF